MLKINITSGEYLNSYLENKIEGIFLPFNESMIQGPLIYPLFNDEFINLRANVHNVSKQTYINKLEK